MELSAEDIETLRSAERALYNRPGLQDLIKSMADRLSPPEPEQPDEATVWTRKVLHAEYQITAYATGEMDGRAQFIAARQVLSELIASKDDEIEQIVKREIGTVDQLEKALSELAALRAENERLRVTGNALVDAIERTAPRLMDMEVQMQNRGYPPPRPEHRFADQFEAFRAALKAAQEVGA